MNNPIAHEILNQLGGNKFIATTGSYCLGSINNGLIMKLRKNKLKASFLIIQLNPLDLYNMKFYSYEGKTLSFTENVYFDQLQEIFTDKTGLNCTL